MVEVNTAATAVIPSIHFNTNGCFDMSETNCKFEEFCLMGYNAM
jgi:hypothetical protein